MWAISSDTVNSLVGLSLNFFFILPLLNSGKLNWVIFVIDFSGCRSTRQILVKFLLIFLLMNSEMNFLAE